MVQCEADRTFSNKSTSSCRLTVAYPGRNTYVHFESLFELKCAMYFWTRVDVVDLRTQLRVVYHDESGVHEHFADLIVTFWNGEVVLYACRPVGRDTSGKLARELENIRNQTLRFHADRCEMLTDELITEARVYRAHNILRSRKFRNSANCERLHEIMTNVGMPVRVFQAYEMFGNEGACWNAMWNLIGDGRIDHIAPDDNSELTNSSWISVVRHDA